VHQLTRSVLLLALDQQRRWAEAGLVLPVAVNVTAWDLPEPDLADWVARQLDRHGIPAGNLVLEVTESALMVEATRSAATLRALDALGVAISLDDFGTGYASLTNLRTLPVSEVKIDRSFVAGMRSDPADETVVRSILELGRALGLRTVAEGVEDAATRDALLRLGCTQAQGHHFAPALPPEDFTRWLAATGRPHPAGSLSRR
jgi:EAL domain-containing protein (putative c-di-GMP-specific phosphodiesterase class I)